MMGSNTGQDRTEQDSNGGSNCCRKGRRARGHGRRKAAWRVGRSVGQFGSQSSSSTGRSYAVGKGPVWQQPTPNSFSGKGAVGEANTKCGEGRPLFSN
jgi:hypothetical protein